MLRPCSAQGFPWRGRRKSQRPQNTITLGSAAPSVRLGVHLRKPKTACKFENTAAKRPSLCFWPWALAGIGFAEEVGREPQSGDRPRAAQTEQNRPVPQRGRARWCRPEQRNESQRCLKSSFCYLPLRLLYQSTRVSEPHFSCL